MLTLLLIPCIASGSDEINKGDSDYAKNFGLAATQEICEYLEKNKEGISETTKEASVAFESEAAGKLFDVISKMDNAVDKLTHSLYKMADVLDIMTNIVTIVGAIGIIVTAFSITEINIHN